MVFPLERRRFSRYRIPLAVEYRSCSPDGKPQGQAWLRDLSLGGAYLKGPRRLLLRQGQIIHLTITLPPPHLYGRGLSRLVARGVVVRLEPAGPERPHNGVALHFPEGLSFAPENPGNEHL